MARLPKIRISKNDQREFSRLARNTKAKYRRIEKKYGKQAVNIIEDSGFDISVPSKVEDFKTRKEFNEWKQRMSSFTNRANQNFQFEKNQYDVVASKKMLSEAERNTKKAQKQADAIIDKVKDKETIYRGEKTGTTVGQEMQQMGKPSAGGINRPKDFDFDKINTPKRLRTKLDNMRKQADEDYYSERNKTMRDNFIELLEQNPYADDLVDMLKEVNPDDFFEIYLFFKEFDFEDFDSDGTSYLSDNVQQRNMEQMKTYIERYEEDYKSDLRIF